MAVPPDRLALLRARRDLAEAVRLLTDYLRAPEHPTPVPRAAAIVVRELRRLADDLEQAMPQDAAAPADGSGRGPAAPGRAAE